MNIEQSAASSVTDTERTAMPTRRSLRWQIVRAAGVTLLCLALSALVGLWYLARPNDLIAASRHVGSGADFSQWVSDTEYISQPTGQAKGASWGDRPITVTRYNLISHTRTRFDLKDREIAYNTHAFAAPSPDGKWLLTTIGGADTVIELATGKTRTWDNEGDEYHFSPAWMPDSRHYVTVPTVGDGYVLIRSLIPGEKDVRCTAQSHWNWREMMDFRITSTGRLLILEEPDASDSSPRLSIHEYSLDARSCLLRAQQITPPPQIERPVAVLSPSGDRIAWYGPKKTDTRLQAMLHRLLPLIPLPKQRTGAIWISNADGSNLHELGVLSVTLDNDEFWDPNVLWLPSGKAISFEYGDGLYTVSVDQH